MPPTIGRNNQEGVVLDFPVADTLIVAGSKEEEGTLSPTTPKLAHKVMGEDEEAIVSGMETAAVEVATSVVSITNSINISRSCSRSRARHQGSHYNSSSNNSNIQLLMEAKHKALHRMTNKEDTSNNELTTRVREMLLIAHTAYDTHGPVVALADSRVCKRLLLHFWGRVGLARRARDLSAH
jgi:hypothetical protein